MVPASRREDDAMPFDQLNCPVATRTAEQVAYLAFSMIADAKQEASSGWSQMQAHNERRLCNRRKPSLVKRGKRQGSSAIRGSHSFLERTL